MSIRSLISFAVAATAAAGFASGRCADIAVQFTVHETATLMNLDGTVVTDSKSVY